MKRLAFSLVALVAVAAAGYFLQQRPHPATPENRVIVSGTMGDLILKSSVFKQNEPVPAKHTCDGANVNPFLELRNAPEGTQSFALIIDDPDATGGVTWDHWVLWNIGPKTQYISEDNVPAGAAQGKNSWGKTVYGGPCPPRGSKPHRYQFKLYALDVMLDLPEGATKQELERAMGGHILGQTVLVGRYGRQ